MTLVPARVGAPRPGTSPHRSGVAQSAERSAVNRNVVGSSPTPGVGRRNRTRSDSADEWPRNPCYGGGFGATSPSKAGKCGSAHFGANSTSVHTDSTRIRGPTPHGGSPVSAPGGPAGRGRASGASAPAAASASRCSSASTGRSGARRAAASAGTRSPASTAVMSGNEASGDTNTNTTITAATTPRHSFGPKSSVRHVTRLDTAPGKAGNVTRKEGGANG
jgi:hypothetical protein